MLLPRIPAEVIHLLELLVRGIEERDVGCDPRPFVGRLLAGNFVLVGRELIDVMVIIVGVQYGKGLVRRIRLGKRGGREKSESKCELEMTFHQ